MALGRNPVFAREWLTGTRRWQLYAGRVLFGTVLLGCVWAMWTDFSGRELSPALLARVGERLYFAAMLSQLALIALVTPAMTAGAICQDKANGSLLHLLTTDLSDAEIVFGKLLARLVPAVMLMAAGVPILMICGLLGGLDLNAVLGATAVIAGVAMLCGSGALAISVWARKPHGALMASYFALLGWLALLPVAELLLAMVVGMFMGNLGAPPWLPAITVLGGAS